MIFYYFFFQYTKFYGKMQLAEKFNTYIEDWNDEGFPVSFSKGGTDIYLLIPCLSVWLGWGQPASDEGEASTKSGTTADAAKRDDWFWNEGREKVSQLKRESIDG